MSNRCFICCNDPFPFGTANSNYIRNMALALYKADYEVIVVGLIEKDTVLGKEECGVYERIQFVNILNKRSKLPFRVRNHLLFGKDIVKVLSRFDIVPQDRIIVYTDFISVTNSLLSKYKKNNQCDNIAYCIVEWFQAHQFTCSYLSLDYIFWNLHFDFLMPRYHKVIGISEKLSKHFKCLGCRTLTLPCLVDCEQVSPNLIRKSKEQYDFIYPGAATNKDSLEGMLKGLLLLNDDESKKIRFHFTTLRPEKLLEAAKCQNDALEQLKDVLIFHGRMEYSDLLNLYQEMDFLFLARERNIITESNFPSKVPEMLAYGTVPVCSKVGDYTNLYLKNGIDSIVFEGATPEACADAYRKAIAIASNEMKTMRANARKLAETKLDYRMWDRALKKFFD